MLTNRNQLEVAGRPLVPDVVNAEAFECAEVQIVGGLQGDLADSAGRLDSVTRHNRIDRVRQTLARARRLDDISQEGER